MKLLEKIRNRLSPRASAGPKFDHSSQYWDDRYDLGGNSGAGSYGRLADFKAEVLNTFVENHGVSSIVEFGCGDGNQLSLAKYPSYVGVDVSPKAVAACQKKFAHDKSKSFVGAIDANEMFDLSLSLDVIYHLIEDDVFTQYMENLFDSARSWVGIYSSNMTNEEFEKRFPALNVPHVRHRRFDSWITQFRPEWGHFSRIENRYPHDPSSPGETSFAEFNFYERRPSS